MAENKIFDFIRNKINEHEVVLFMKGTADFPQCGFSGMVVSILQSFSVRFQDYNVLANEELRQGIKEFSDWPTIPQLYVKGEFIGGCDIVREMYQSGSLSTLLRDLQTHGITAHNTKRFKNTQTSIQFTE